MNINDLSKIDLQKLDIKKLQETALQRKDILINIAMCVVTLFVVVSNFSSRFKDDVQLKNKIAEMEAKLAIIKEYNQGLKDIDFFIKKFPPSLNIDKVIAFVTENAKKHDMRIVYFSPAHSDKNGTYEKTTIQFSVNAKTYADIVYFLRDLEHSSYAMRIDNWKASPSEDTASQKDTDDSDQTVKELNVILEISTIRLVK